MNSDHPQVQLALRLRALREDQWPDRRITQPQLGSALGVSVPLISSWESTIHPRVPPLARIDSYAALFAAERSFDTSPPRQLDATEMTGTERQVMVELRSELRRIRAEALEAAAVYGEEHAPFAVPIGRNPWRFDDGGAVTIVCARFPSHMLATIPYTNVKDPDYIELLTYSELDSLFELHGHIRAANPDIHVRRRAAGTLVPDDYQGHLAVLGGVDWNPLTRTIMDRLGLPVRQVADWAVEGGQYFEVEENRTRHQPVLSGSGDQAILEEDVALFARARNPWNREKTVTICHGMYGRGTFGAIRALTDIHFRDRNTAHIQTRFGNSEAYCILTRVPVVEGETLTPDWTTGELTLFEWSR